MIDLIVTPFAIAEEDNTGLCCPCLCKEARVVEVCCQNGSALASCLVQNLIVGRPCKADVARVDCVMAKISKPASKAS